MSSCRIGSCTGTALNRRVRDVVARGTAFDFVADDTDGVGVHHRASSCELGDAGARLASGGSEVADLVSDDDHLYWSDRAGGRVRRVPRAGGAASDVMTGLGAPRHLALDAMSRVLVGTDANGVFRGWMNGTCAAVATKIAPVGALAVGPTAAFVANATSLRKLRP